MSKSHPPYVPEYRRQIVELSRVGRIPGERSREFECSAHAIRNWVRNANRDEGRRDDGLAASECEELRRLRLENRKLREERDIPKKSRLDSSGRQARYRRDLRVRDGESSPSLSGHDVPGAGRLRQQVLHVARLRAYSTYPA